MDILNDSNLETIKLNGNHKDIKIEKLTNIINKLDIKRTVEKIKSQTDKLK